MSSQIKGIVLWLYVLLPLAWGVFQTIKKTLALFS
ncbi:MFS transporter small subunit [Andreprevotia chitinilytica]